MQSLVLQSLGFQGFRFSEPFILIGATRTNNATRPFSVLEEDTQKHRPPHYP